MGKNKCCRFCGCPSQIGSPYCYRHQDPATREYVGEFTNDTHNIIKEYNNERYDADLALIESCNLNPSQDELLHPKDTT